MTEEQAKSKMCPLMSIGNGAAPCVGTYCMMWRWDSVPNPNHTHFMAQFPPQAEPAYLPSTTDGHCGLAHG